MKAGGRDSLAVVSAVLVLKRRIGGKAAFLVTVSEDAVHRKAGQVADSNWILVLGVTCKCLFLSATAHPCRGPQLLQILLPAGEQTFKT